MNQEVVTSLSGEYISAYTSARTSMAAFPENSLATVNVRDYSIVAPVLIS